MRFFLNRKIIIVLTVFCGLFFSVQSAEAGTLVRPPNNLGLIGYWNFNEGTSTIAGDSSGNRNTGTLTDMATGSTTSGWTENGKLGPALSFDGVDDYVNVTQTSGLPIYANTSYTVSMWVKGAPNQVDKRIFSEGSSVSNNPLLNIGTNAGNGLLDILIRDDSGAGQLNHALSTRTVFDNTWHHVVWVDNNGSVSLYVDGVLDGANFNYTRSTLTLNRTSIGAILRASMSHPFAGSIDEVRVYNRTLSAAQAAALYRSGISKFGGSDALTQGSLNDGLVGHWTFDGNNTDWRTNTTRDVSGQNNTGTLVGLPTSTAPVSGKFGQALNFDRNTANYVQLASTSATSINTNFTLSAWVNADNSDCCKGIIAKGSTYGSVGQYRLMTGYAGLSNAYLRLDVSDGTTMVNVAAFPGISATLPNMWHHVACNTDTTTMNCYWDGNFIASSSRASIGSTFTGDSWFALGTLNPNQMYYGGRIDDVRIYNRVLPAAEIKQLYNLGSGKTNASSTALSQGTTLKDGLVGLWTFDGQDTVSSITDRSGQGNNGRFVGGATSSAKVIGKLGQALAFTSGGATQNGDYVLVSNQTPFNFERTDSFSTCAWIKPTAVLTVNEIVTKLYNVAPYNGWEFYLNSSAQPTLSLTNTYPTNQLSIRGNTAVTLDTWTHVCVAYSGTSDPSGVAMYINGVSQSLTTSTNNLSASIQNIYDLGIGQRTTNTGSNSWPFNGSIDEVRIYNRVLTANEVKQLYQMGQ